MATVQPSHESASTFDLELSHTDSFRCIMDRNIGFVDFDDGNRRSSRYNYVNRQNYNQWPRMRNSFLLSIAIYNKIPNLELSDIRGHVLEFSTNQWGSRFIQEKLDAASTEVKTMVFAELSVGVVTLMTHAFGNYIVQKFLEVGTVEQICALARQIAVHAETLAFDSYGCRVIKKAIESKDHNHHIAIASKLIGHISRCVVDNNGYHVIQKCLEVLPRSFTRFLVCCFQGSIVRFSTNPYGCHVIQRVLEQFIDDGIQKMLMDEILMAAVMLAKDPYGNYVLQHVIERGNPYYSQIAISKLRGKMWQLSKQKYASNVVEKCIVYAIPDLRVRITEELLGCGELHWPFRALMTDQFGNYVVHKVIDFCCDGQFQIVHCTIKRFYSHQLRKVAQRSKDLALVRNLLHIADRRANFVAQTERRANFIAQTERKATFIAQTERRANFIAQTERMANFIAQGERRANCIAQTERRANFIAQNMAS